MSPHRATDLEERKGSNPHLTRPRPHRRAVHGFVGHRHDDERRDAETGEALKNARDRPSGERGRQEYETHSLPRHPQYAVTVPRTQDHTTVPFEGRSEHARKVGVRLGEQDVHRGSWAG